MPPVTLTAEFKIVTPMFIGGADQSPSDGIRPPSVKGALRFWWRALNWGKFREAPGADDAAALRALHEEEVRWHRLDGGQYKLLKPGKDGVIRSIVFPGLWLDVPALLGENLPQVLATLSQGLASEEHTKFAAEIAAKLGQ